MSESESECPEVGWKYVGKPDSGWEGMEGEVIFVGAKSAVMCFPNSEYSEYLITFRNLAYSFTRVHPEVFPEGVGTRGEVVHFSQTPSAHPKIRRDLRLFGDDTEIELLVHDHERGLELWIDVPTETLRWMIDRVTKTD